MGAANARGRWGRVPGWAVRLGPAVREGSAVLAGGLMAGLMVTAVARAYAVGLPAGRRLDWWLVGASVVGAGAQGLVAAIQGRSRARRAQEARGRTRQVEVAHARLAAYTDQLVAALEQYRAAKTVLVRQIDGVTESTGQAAARLAEGTSRVDATIQELVQGLESALAEAEGRDEAGNGQRQEVRDAIRAMQRYIESRRDELALDRERVQAVRRQAEDLSRLARLVEDLADRTKVLAINASIEAARAGGHGRAFAVVADEVHKLAQQSARAAVAIAEGLAAVRRAVDDQFAAKLNPEKEAEERRLLESFADALGAIDGRSEALARIHRRVLAEAREHGRQVASTVMETFASLQFQDVVRQRLDQVCQALHRMIRHTERLLECARQPEGPFPEPFEAEGMADAYRMEPQRTAHREALGQEGAAETAPGVELF